MSACADAIVDALRQLDCRVQSLVELPDQPFRLPWMSSVAYEILVRAIGCNYNTVVNHSIMDIRVYLKTHEVTGDAYLIICSAANKLGFELLGPKIGTDGRVWVWKKI